MERLKPLLIQHPVLIGWLIRIVLAVTLPGLMDHTNVPYTDIDFHVYNDAAVHIQQSGSPFDRTTYRYTPFLALLLSYLPNAEWSRYLFCTADVCCGWMLLPDKKTSKTTLVDTILWLYNPLMINICTRGSAESLLVLLPVLLTYQIATNGQAASYQRAMLAGVTHGVAMHAKLYPIIYTLSFMTAFCQINDIHDTALTTKHPARIIWIWIKRCLQPTPFVFGLSSVVTFVGLTVLAVWYYGDVALQEGLLYHFSRVDHRHNYSMHWYWIYLSLQNPVVSMKLVGRVLLLPQLLLLLYISLGVAPQHLALALFLQTFCFVTLNKVITAQYFTWYLCLLPLCYRQFGWTKRLRNALLWVLSSVGVWLASAYCLEMQGMAVHRLVWLASLGFFVANVNLFGALLASVKVSKGKME